MNDRELLELAAKAAGIDHNQLFNSCVNCSSLDKWNPLTDDGDALRLMVHLSITIEFGPITVASYKGCAEVQNMIHAHSYERNDRSQVIRRAITRAAAEIGRDMP